MRISELARQPWLVTTDREFLNPPEESAVSSRHVAYGLRAKEVSEGTIEGLRVLVVSPTGFDAARQEWSREGCRVDNISWVRARRWLSRQGGAATAGRTVIAGDPFLVGTIGASVGANRDLLQIQCHGDFGDPSWATSAKTRLRKELAKRNLHRAQSVRAVSAAQAEKLSGSFGVSPDLITVAPVPVPVEFLETRLPSSGAGPLQVLFVGRLHPERGPRLWAQIAHEVALRDREAQFHVVGDGPSREDFVNALRGGPAGARFTMHGRMRAYELAAFLSDASQRGVLLNTAPLEAFGRSMVEAGLSGVRVVSLRTSGSIDLEPLVPGMRIVGSGSVHDLAAEVLAGATPHTSLEQVLAFRQQWRSAQEASIDRLVGSWLG